MKTSNTGLKLIKSHEGLRLAAYLCPANVWTIGYGHTGTAKPGMVITEQQAEELLKKDLTHAENVVNSENLNINQNMFDALISFVFNVGSGNFKSSTLLKRIKANPRDQDITYQFSRWNKGGGKVLPGLTRRRAEEARLYFDTVKLSDMDPKTEHRV